ncbi:helix-turn-helix domain-containing protein [Paenibacillus sp. MBLB4367]|uniref:helix-turn-helix domain-containing protein n=1 Tax=Paenibacillus sp. MBLB4367 TaxID=3384767 RepID=UPI003907FECD
MKGPFYLRRSQGFAPSYQTTFKQKLLDTRIEVAKNLLATTELSVQEILERVGYSLHRSFVHVFKQKTGFAPVEYRRSMQTGKKG